MMLDEMLKERLRHLQFLGGSRVILIDQVPVGYGGQLAGRLLGLKIALVLDRMAIFSKDADWPYVQSVVRPFSWTRDPRTAQEAPLLELPGPDFRDVVRFDYFVAQKQLKTRSLTVEQWIERSLVDKFQLTRDDLQKLDGWLISWLQFVPDFEKRLSADIRRLGVSKKSLGVHVRRGDKKIETPYVPSEKINDAINNIYSIWKFEEVFVATDNAEVLSDLALPAGVALLFDREEVRYNNANHKMLMANPEMAEEETYTAFKNFRLLCECGGVVGQSNAHFAVLAGSYIFNRDSHPERIIMLDPNSGPRLVRLGQSVKRGFRSLVKSLVPRRILVRIDRMIHYRS